MTPFKRIRKHLNWKGIHFRCSSCERPARRKHGGWGRYFICSQCLADLVFDRKEAFHGC